MKNFVLISWLIMPFNGFSFDGYGTWNGESLRDIENEKEISKMIDQEYEKLKKYDYFS